MAQLRAPLIDANVVQVGDSNNNVVTAAAAAIDRVIDASPGIRSSRVWHLDFDCKKSSSDAMNFSFTRDIAV